MSWNSRKKKEGIFCNVYFFWKNFFNICDLSVSIVYWIHFQNIHILHIKKHYFIHFCCLLLTVLKAFSVSLSMKEITVHLSDQNYKSQLNLILLFLQVLPLFVSIVLKLSKTSGKRFNNHDYQLSETGPWTLS